MSDTSRIAAWLDILASTTNVGSSNATMYQIIVALLERIEALEADVATLRAERSEREIGDDSEFPALSSTN